MKKPKDYTIRPPKVPEKFKKVKKDLEKLGLYTVCQESHCPNIADCWSDYTATFLAMGDICTRGCNFCAIKTGIPKDLDELEPQKIAFACKKMELKYVVITSVDRDDLVDGGATHFANVISSIRIKSPGTTIEILTPDFLKKNEAVDIILNSEPDVFNHNLETVPSLYLKIRPGARYFQSLNLLKSIKEGNGKIFTKSGIMVGLGETRDEVLQVMDDLIIAKVDFLTIGQYLQPTPKHASVIEYIHPDTFESYAAIARAKGFKMVSSSSFTRSSFHADEDFLKLKESLS